MRYATALPTVNDWHIHQMDVKTEFLQRSLDTNIYSKQSPGCKDEVEPNYVCMLKKASTA